MTYMGLNDPDTDAFKPAPTMKTANETSKNRAKADSLLRNVYPSTAAINHRMGSSRVPINIPKCATFHILVYLRGYSSFQVPMSLCHCSSTLGIPADLVRVRQDVRWCTSLSSSLRVLPVLHPRTLNLLIGQFAVLVQT